jgi:hypothetical protein
MTFPEKYLTEKTWHGKVLIMSLYHTAMTLKFKNWTLTDTAKQFNCSIGLVSENLALAKLIDINPKIMKCKSRQEALEKRRKT